MLLLRTINPSKLFLLTIIILVGVFAFVRKNTEVSLKFKCESQNYKCYEDYYSQVVKVKGIKAAFDDLKTRYNSDNLTKEFCHPITHAIGRAASEKFKTPAEAFIYGDNFCSSGYYHGVLEGIAAKMGRDKLLTNLNSVCSDIKGKASYSLDYYNCVHGLGHGLMAITDDELFQSLDYCDKLNGDWEQKSCASGVFMENIVVDGINHKTKYLKPDDLLYPCDRAPEKFKSPCYLMQSSYILTQNGFNLAKTFYICSLAEVNHKIECYQSLGRDISGAAISDIGKTKESCMLGKDFDQKLGCLVGAARDFNYYFHDNKKGDELCKAVDDVNLKKECLSQVDLY